MWTIYGLFYPEECKPGSQCITPYLEKKPNLEVIEISQFLCGLFQKISGFMLVGINNLSGTNEK